MEQIIDGVDATKEKIKEAYKELKSYRKVGKLFNVSCMTVQRIVKDVITSAKVAEIRYLKEQLRRKEKECEELKKTVMTKCPQCGEYLSPVGLELYEKINNYNKALDEIEKLAKYLQRTQDELDYVDLNCILNIIQKVKGE